MTESSQEAVSQEAISEAAEETSLAPVEVSESGPTDEQIRQVLQWVTEGQSTEDIQLSMKDHWPEANGEAIALAVTNRLLESSDFDSDVLRGMCIEATREVYRRALETADLAVALRAIRQLWEMTQTIRI